MISISGLDRPVVDERERLVGALVPRESERRQPRAPDRAGHADVPADAQLVVRSMPPPIRAGQQTPVLGEPSRRPCRLGSPLAGVRVGVGLGLGPPSDVDRDRGTRVDRGVLAEPSVATRRSSPARGRCAAPASTPVDSSAPTVRTGSAWDRGAARRRGTPCSDSRRRAPRSRAWRPRSGRRRRCSSRDASTRPRSGVRASAAPTARWPRSVDATRRATRAVGERNRWQRVERDHVRRVVEDVDAAPNAAAEVDVVGVPPVGGEDRDDRLQRRGRRTAIWSALKPEYEVPHIPTLPFDHSCSASHAIVVS